MQLDTLQPYQHLKKQLSFFKQHPEIEFPYYRVCEGLSDNFITIGGKKYINYAGYNYLGLSGHPEVKKAAIQAIEKYGTSCSASRTASGSRPIHHELEKALADLWGVEACLLFTAGYMTNESTIGHLMCSKDLIVYDELSHRSIITGCIESGARRVPFPHNDYAALDSILSNIRKDYQNVLVIIEGVYSMDGDIPDLLKLIEIKRKHEAWLMVDEAHSLGTIGTNGKGIGEYFHLKDKSNVDIWMGTLSKSFASCGGFIGGTKDLIDYLKYSAPGAIYSAAMPASVAAAALTAVKILQKEPERPKILQDRVRLFLELCKKQGIDTYLSHDSPVIPVITESSLKALYLAEQLMKHQILAIPMIHPAVDEKLARVRFFITSEHTEEDIKTTVEILANEWQQVREMQVR